MMGRATGRLAVGAALLTLAACGDAGPDAIRCFTAESDNADFTELLASVPDSARVIEQGEITPSLEVDLAEMTRCPSGLYAQDLVVGTGDVAELEDRVAVRYTGWVFNGQEFDSTGPDDTAVFPLQNLIPGWQEGIPGMREGGRRRLVIPYPFAYGPAARSAVIVPYSDLIFEIELVQVGDPDAEGTTGS